MAGGNWRNRREPDPGLVAAIECVGRRAPSVACIGAANNDDASFLRWFAALAVGAGAGRVELAPFARRGPDPASALRVLDEGVHGSSVGVLAASSSAVFRRFVWME